MRSPTVEIFVDSEYAQYSFYISLHSMQRIKSYFLNTSLDLWRIFPMQLGPN